MKTASLSADLIRVPSPSEELAPIESAPRRALVLTDEGASHRFRANLPPHIRQDLHDIPAEALWRLTAEDVRGFASVYFATLAAILVFII